MKINSVKVATILANFKASCIAIFRPRQLGQFLALQFMCWTLLVASIFMFGAAIELNSIALAFVASTGLLNAYDMLKASDAIEI